MAGQTRSHSILESMVNIFIGYSISLVAQLLVFPAFGGNFTLMQNMKIGGIFTVLSLVRSYFLRRFFNWITITLGDWGT